METIITSLIVAVPSLLATILSNKKSTALMEYKIDQLDKKVHEHNNLVNRTYKCEERLSVLEEKVK